MTDGRLHGAAAIGLKVGPSVNRTSISLLEFSAADQCVLRCRGRRAGRMIILVNATTVLLIVAAFLASAVEMVEALAIVLGVGVSAGEGNAATAGTV